MNKVRNNFGYIIIDIDDINENIINKINNIMNIINTEKQPFRLFFLNKSIISLIKLI